MNLIVIDENAPLEELARRHKERVASEPKPKKRPKGWAAMWEAPHPADEYTPPPLLTPEELKGYRESKGWYQRHLGDRTGYGHKTIRYMEIGASKISAPLSVMIRYMMEIDRLRAENEELRKQLREAP